MPQLRPISFLVVALAFAAACGDGTTDPQDREIKANPSFSADIVEITNRRGCTASSCHGGGAGEMTLGDAATTYAAWVNVPSAADATETRVIPGDAENSYVVKMVEGRVSGRPRMPLGAAPLDDIDLTNLRNWIDNGAPNN